MKFIFYILFFFPTLGFSATTCFDNHSEIKDYVVSKAIKKRFLFHWNDPTDGSLMKVVILFNKDSWSYLNLRDEKKQSCFIIENGDSFKSGILDNSGYQQDLKDAPGACADYNVYLNRLKRNGLYLIGEGSTSHGQRMLFFGGFYTSGSFAPPWQIAVLQDNKICRLISGFGWTPFDESGEIDTSILEGIN